MKNINPLFMLFASFFIFLISIYSLNIANKNYNIQKENYKNYKNVALEYKRIKEEWINIKSQRKLIEKLLLNNKIKTASIKVVSKTLKVGISNINTNKLHRFINKLLNTKLSIYKLKFTKNYIEFEVGVR